MATFNQELIEGMNGTDILFKTNSMHKLGSLRVIEVSSGLIRSIRDVIEICNTYFKIAPAPLVGSSLELYYEALGDIPIGVDGLNITCSK